MRRGALLAAAPAHEGSASDCRWAGGGEMLVSAGYDGHVALLGVSVSCCCTRLAHLCSASMCHCKPHCRHCRHKRMLHWCVDTSVAAVCCMYKLRHVPQLTKAKRVIQHPQVDTSVAAMYDLAFEGLYRSCQRRSNKLTRLEAALQWHMARGVLQVRCRFGSRPHSLLHAEITALPCCGR